MGRFIVIDGLDGSGKETQAKLLINYLEGKGIKTRYLSFPCYESDSSVPVRMYLSGELGKHPGDTNAYAASMFFACDRFISYKTDWIKDCNDPDTVVVANRYTTANAVHQLSKLPESEADAFLDWLWDFEFKKLGLPEPDDVLYLEMTPDISEKLIRSRSEQTGRTIDIHEADRDFLKNSYRAALYASDALGWNRITCCEGGEPLSIELIHQKIIAALGI